MIDECAVGAESDFTEGAQQAVDFVAGEDFGQGFVALDVDLLPDVPVDAKVVAVEGAQRADSLIDRAGSELALVLEVNEEIEHALGREFRQVILRVMVGELVDPTVVGFTSALGESFELDIPGEVLIPLD